MTTRTDELRERLVAELEVAIYGTYRSGAICGQTLPMDAPVISRLSEEGRGWLRSFASQSADRILALLSQQEQEPDGWAVMVEGDLVPARVYWHGWDGQRGNAEAAAREHVAFLRRTPETFPARAVPIYLNAAPAEREREEADLVRRWRQWGAQVCGFVPRDLWDQYQQLATDTAKIARGVSCLTPTQQVKP